MHEPVWRLAEQLALQENIECGGIPLERRNRFQFWRENVHIATFAHPAQDTAQGLAGRVFHDDYVSRVVKVESLGGGLERIHCEILYDPLVRRGRLTEPFLVTVVAPVGMQDYRAYQTEVLDRMKRAKNLVDVRLTAIALES